MMVSTTFQRYLILIMNLFVLCNTAKLSSIERTYKKGVEAYAGERWSECIAKFEETLHLFKLYKTILINCRLKCNMQDMKTDIEDIEDIKVYENFLKTRLCITKCQKEDLEDASINALVPEYIVNNIKSKKPYEYLHICYFQMNAMPKAASAAYTYLVANPKDDKMEKNVKYYIDQPEVDINEVVDLESEDYEIFFKIGLSAYNKKKWGETVANMEEALTDYLSWENRCRAECQQQSELEWTPEYTVTISNYMMSHLMCKQNCQEKLKYIGYNTGYEFIADLLNYLQISYYHLGRIEDAAKAVESYLLLVPKDEDMLSNKYIYSSLTDEKNFIERSDVAYYFNRNESEKKVIDLYYKSETNNEILSMKQ